MTMSESNLVTRRIWWTVKQIAEHYGLSARSVYDTIAAGGLVAHRFGLGRGGMRIADADRLAWEQQCRDNELAPAPPPMTRSRLITSDLVKKHFGL